MTGIWFRKWWDKTFGARKQRGHKPSFRVAPQPTRRRLFVEQLEDRVVPSTSISIISGAYGTGSLDSYLTSTNGTITATDVTGAPGPVATLTVAALETPGAGVEISITNPSGDSGISFGAGLGTINLLTQAGVIDLFDSPSSAITFGAGTTLASSGDLALQAATGIGTAAAPILTQVPNLVATTAGGIFISNTGALTIGFSGDPFQGVQDTGADSDVVSVTASGAITDTASNEVISGPEDVSVTTTSGDIILGGDNSQGTVNSSVGAITLDAESGNLFIGDPTTATSGDISSNSDSSVSLEASGNINIDYGSFVSAPGTLTVTAGGNISLLGAASMYGGDITLTTGTGDTLTIDSQAFTVYAIATYNNGNITINTDQFDFNSAIDTIDTGTGNILIQPVTSGQAIEVGTNYGSDGNLDVSNADINAMTANVLQIGNSTDAGAISVTDAISDTTTIGTLALITPAAITESTSSPLGTLNVVNLDLEGAAGVSAGNANDVTGTLAGAATTSGAFDFENADSLTVGSVSTFSGTDTGITTAGGDITLTVSAAGDTLTINDPVDSTDAGAVPAGADITLTADEMTLDAAITAGTSSVFIAPYTADQLIDLGASSSTGTLGLTNAELLEITAATVTVGALTDTSGITVSNAIDDTTTFDTLILITGGAITETATAGTLTVTDLGLEGADGVSATDANAVSLAAGSVTTSGDAFDFNDDVDLTVGVAGPVTGITTAGGDITLTVSAADDTLTINDPVDSTDAGTVPGVADITLTADEMTIDAAITAGTSSVFIAPYSTGQLIDLGASSSSGTLGLTNAELLEITAATVSVGVAADTGGITVSSAIDDTTTFDTLLLTTGGAITETATTGTLTVTDLGLEGADGVSASNSNAVSLVAGSVTTSGDAFAFNDAVDLTVGVVGLVTGITTAGGAITLTVSTADDTLTINDPIDSTDASTVPTGADITLTADEMTIDAAITAGTSSVFIAPYSTGQLIDLGASSSSGTLGLTNAELLEITAASVTVGALTDTGGITVSSAIDDTTTFDTLILITGGAITETATAGTLTVTDLGLEGADGVSASNSNAVSLVAGSVTTSDAFEFLDTLDLTIGVVGSFTGITTSDGAVTVTVSAATLTVADDIAAGTAAVDLSVASAGGLLTNNAALTGGSATLISDEMALEGGTINVGTFVDSEIATLAPFSSGQTIDLGASGQSGPLNLSQTALSTITANILRIGSETAMAVPLATPATNAGPAGDITLEAAISLTTVDTFSLLTGGSIGQSVNTDTISETNLALEALGSVDLEGDNNVTTVAGSAGSAFTFDDNASNLTVGGVDDSSGVTAAGNIQVILSSGGLLTLTNPIESTAGNVLLQSDNMTLDATITAVSSQANPNSLVNLEPYDGGATIELGGSNASLTLGLTSAELNEVTANILRIGNSAMDFPIEVVASISVTTSTILSLKSSAALTESAGALVSATDLSFQVGSLGGTASSPFLISAASLAGEVSTGSIYLSSTTRTAISTTPLDGVVGLTAGPGGVASLVTTATSAYAYPALYAAYAAYANALSVYLINPGNIYALYALLYAADGYINASYAYSYSLAGEYMASEASALAAYVDDYAASAYSFVVYEQTYVPPIVSVQRPTPTFSYTYVTYAQTGYQYALAAYTDAAYAYSYSLATAQGN